MPNVLILLVVLILWVGMVTLLVLALKRVITRSEKGWVDGDQKMLLFEEQRERKSKLDDSDV